MNRLLLAALLIVSQLVIVTPQSTPVVANVIVVSMDGFRWQELFGGLQSEYVTKDEGGVGDIKAIEARFGGATASERRERLMPFFWTVVAKQGQVFGDETAASPSRVTNGLRFSYPGYNEMLAGFADPRIDSNDEVYNPNVTVLEWLNRREGFAGRVAAFASWELLPWILNEPRSGVPSNGAGEPIAKPTTERERLLNDVSTELPPYWGATRFDAPTAFGAVEYLQTRKPRVLYVMLGETDEWAHQRRYDLYLDSAFRNDRMIRRLWDAAQAMPEYAKRTALVLTTDHGRGPAPADWPNHGRETPASDRIWIAVMGPGIAPLGVRSGVPTTQAQVAATIALLLGTDYVREQPKAAAPLKLTP